MTRLAAFLQIRPGEAPRVVLVATLFALIEAGRGIGANTADALFFLRFGVENLPFMFMLLGATNFLVSLTYAAGLGRFDKRRFFVTILLALASAVFIERGALGSGLPALYPVLWITINIISSVLGLLTWNIAGEVCDARQAKRLFSLFVSAGILGGVAGNFITGPAARLLGTENLLIVYAGFLLLAFALTRRITRQFFRPSAPRTGESFLDEVRAGFDFVRRSPLFKVMAAAAVLFSILYFSISFPFSTAVSASFSGEAEVAGFLGLFSGIVTALTFLISLFVANRLYARIGVVNAVLLLPIAYLVGFVLFAVDFSLSSAIIARSMQLIVLGGLAVSAYSTFFNVVPPERRGQVRSFDSGVPEQIGVALSGLLLILGERVLTTTQIFVMGMFVAVACGALVWRMRQAYGAALVAALRAGRFEVFSAGEHAFAGFRGDATAIRIAIFSLIDPKPSIRRLAAEMLARMRAVSAAPALVEALSDAEPDVRLAAIRALDELNAQETASALVVLLEDVEVQVRAQAAAALFRFGATHRALPVLDTLLRDPSAEARTLALDALGDVAEVYCSFQPAHARPPFDLAPIVRALRDEAALVRRAACRTLSCTRAAEAVEPLVACLSDPNESVRGAAAQALRLLGAKATGRVLDILRVEETEAHAAALDALDPNDPAVSAPLHEYAHREMARVQTWQALVRAIPPVGRVTRFLRATLEARVARSEQRLVQAVGLLGPGDAMTLVGKSLSTDDAETRAAAVETLETLGDKHLVKEIVPLLEVSSAPDGQTQRAGAAALAQLFAHPDGGLRALAARACSEIGLDALIPELHALKTDPDPLAREAAYEALIQFKEVAPMETLQTVSLMERVLLLHEVPLFAELSPDDLKQIADIAREQFYADGAILCRDGEEGQELYVIASGQVRVVKGSNGSERLLATRRVGDVIGEMAIIDSVPRSATVRAEGEVRTLVIEGNAFKAILRDRPEVALGVLHVLSKRLRERE
ncbi:MAG TPA: HEAT repeat domain-containing protein [Anaerolineae bacterium]|nr:HEAT repeat domain-containing protein [Anaerolineae bacterium]